MESKTPFEQLNYVLEKLLHDRDYLDVKEDFFKENVLPEKDEHYLKMILNKLHKDGYIDFMEGEANRKTYIINREAGHNMNIRRNFNGQLFLANGGYVGEYKRKQEKETNRQLYDGRMETTAGNLAEWTKRLAIRTRYLMWATWAVAAGAIGLVVWEIWDSCHK
ncbi:MAG: hypothetical protein M0Q26_08440 [Chitinophagaceae bacterium]|nr:hypothetical protein [Chitinophagaceae bacterium]